MYQFPKYQHLKHRSTIDELWTAGQVTGQAPLRLKYQLRPRKEEEVPILTGVAAPKKWFRKAVARNRVKRVLRECWRQAQPALLQEFRILYPDRQLILFWMYTHPELPQADELKQIMDKRIQSLLKKWKDDPAANHTHRTFSGAD